MHARLLLALALSTAPLVLEPLAGGGSLFPGLRFTALGLLPWLALSGLPRSARSPVASPACWLAFALPPLGLAWGLDAREAGPLVPSVTLGVGLAGCAFLHASLRLAARGERARRAQAWSWLLVVPLWAALPLATRWAVASAGAATEPSATARHGGPLGWGVGRLWAGEADPVGGLIVLGACALVVALPALVGLGEQDEASPSEETGP